MLLGFPMPLPHTMEQLMTSAPLTIGADMSLAAARSMMADYHVGHLPVRDDGHLVGVVALKDLDRGEPHHPVRAVMLREALVVDPTDIAADVATMMAEKHADAAIVVSGENVVGIFTATDAERALAVTLQAIDERR